MNPFILLSALAQLAVTTPAPIAHAPTCWQSAGPPSSKACIYRAATTSNGDVLYFLHGHGGDEHTWERLRDRFQGRWTATNANPPTVIAISFGPSWSLADKNGGSSSGLLEVFVDQLMPDAEKRLARPVQRRMLMGMSMGGFNATELALKRPALFERVVLACPALLDESPVDVRAAVESVSRRTGGERSMVQFFVAAMHDRYPDAASWAAAAPFELVERAKRIPKLFVSCGDHDEFGFYSVAEHFASAARAHGADVVWKSVPGGHCGFDVPAAADFLSAK